MAESVGYPDSTLKEEGVMHGEQGNIRKHTGDPRAKIGSTSAESGPPVGPSSTTKREGPSHTTLKASGKSGPAQRDWEA